jgi:hypothetical protein
MSTIQIGLSDLRRLAPEGPDHIRRAKLLDQFVGQTGAREYDLTGRNLFRLFMRGTASEDRVREVLRSVFRYYSDGSIGDAYGAGMPFDHPSLWGKDRKPIALFGHPYTLNDEARMSLDLIESLGMVVSVTGRSWYGHGTIQVAVVAPNSLGRAAPWHTHG